MKCPYCGARLRKKDKFCGHCGRQVDLFRESDYTEDYYLQIPGPEDPAQASRIFGDDPVPSDTKGAAGGITADGTADKDTAGGTPADGAANKGAAGETSGEGAVKAGAATGAAAGFGTGDKAGEASGISASTSEAGTAGETAAADREKNAAGRTLQPADRIKPSDSGKARPADSAAGHSDSLPQQIYEDDRDPSLYEDASERETVDSFDDGSRERGREALVGTLIVLFFVFAVAAAALLLHYHPEIIESLPGIGKITGAISVPKMFACFIHG